MRHILMLGILVGSILVSPASEARGPYGSIRVGAWKGGAYTNDRTGAFSHCAAGASYRSGIFFMVMVNSNLDWGLGFAHEKWRLTRGQVFQIALTFDGGTPFNVQGSAISEKLVQVPMPSNSSLIAQFRRAKSMTAFTQGQLFQFKLDQTARLLPTVANCAAKVKENGVASAGDFSLPPPPPKPVAKPVVVSTETESSELQTGKTFTQTGSGFVVSAGGHVVTNQHVVDGCVGDIQGNLTGEAPVKLRLVSSDETNDLALLQAPTPFKEMATIKDKAVRSGESIVAIGYPFHGLLTSDFTVTTGIVSSLSGLLNNTRFLQISAAVQPGNSGGHYWRRAARLWAW